MADDPRAIDLAAHLGDEGAAAHFIHPEGPAPLVVRHADGVPVFALVEGQLVPHDAWRQTVTVPAAAHRVAVSLTLPALEEALAGAGMLGGFATLDALLAAVQTLPDWDELFLDLNGPHPRLVRNRDGQILYLIQNGQVVPVPVSA